MTSQNRPCRNTFAHARTLLVSPPSVGGIPAPSPHVKPPPHARTSANRGALVPILSERHIRRLGTLTPLSRCVFNPNPSPTFVVVGPHSPLRVCSSYDSLGSADYQILRGPIYPVQFRIQLWQVVDLSDGDRFEQPFVVPRPFHKDLS
jgi:hypothetical protein